MTRVLVVDDERIVARDIQMTLEELGYDVAALAHAGQEAVDAAARHEPDIVLMDINLGPGIDGVEASDRIRKAQGIPVVFLTAYSDEETLQRAKLTRPFGYVVKPFDERDLRTNIEIAIYRHQLETELARTKDWLDAVLAGMADLVVAVDLDGNLVDVNAAAMSVLGARPSLTTAGLRPGTPLADVLAGTPEADMAMIQDAVLEVLKMGHASPVPRHTRIGAAKVPVVGSVDPVRDADGRTYGAVLVLRDLRLERTVEALRKENELLKAQFSERAEQLV